MTAATSIQIVGSDGSVAAVSGGALQTSGSGSSASVTLLAGSAIVGKVGIDQTTDGTTNAVHLVAGSALAGKFGIDQTTPGTTNGVSVVGVPITPVVSASGEASHVLKATPGTLFNCYAVNLTSTPGFLVITNTTSAPGDGAITPLDVAPLPAFGSASIDYSPEQGRTYGTGITAIVTSASTPFTKTTGVITAFFNGGVV